MGLRPDEISALIKEQIKHFDDVIELKDVGTVMTVGDGVSLIHGLDNAMLGELLAFPNDVYGMVMNLDEDCVGAVLLGSESTIKEGDEVKRTGKIMEIPVGDEMLGRVVNPLGQAIDGNGEIITAHTRPIERVASGVMTRKSVDQPLQTGITSIDAIIPIGRGQRELIIGDRQTGKTAIAIDTILNQKDQDIYCVYVAIGQKNSTVAQIVEKLRKGGAMEYTTVVSASASELAPVQYIAPYAGCAIAEEWLDQGKDVLIVYDDLSKHAVAYRTVSLLLKRPPGREAYPGDVFYLHSRSLLLQKGKAQRGLGMNTEALSTYQEIITNDTANTRAYIEAAECCRSLAKYQQALKYYEQALDLNPENKYVRIQYIGLLLSLQKFQDALGESSLMTEKDSSAIALHLQAQSFEGMGELLPATGCYYNIQEKYPDDYLAAAQ